MIFGRLLCTTAVPKHEFWEAPPPFFFACLCFVEFAVKAGGR